VDVRNEGENLFKVPLKKGDLGGSNLSKKELLSNSK
jgi:hypothetical protein